jgi:hypothetical protein
MDGILVWTIPTMLTILNITARDVARAQDHVRACEQAWRKSGCRKVTDRELREANDQVTCRARELRGLRSQGWGALRGKLALYWLAKHTGVANRDWLTGGMIVGTSAVALLVIPLILVLGQLPAVLLGLILAFVSFGATSAIILRSLSAVNVGQELEALRGALQRRQRRVTTLEAELRIWRDRRGRAARPTG